MSRSLSSSGCCASPVEEAHQREMIRIHELWQATKAQLRTKTQELEQVRASVAAQSKAKGESEAAINQLHSISVELRDKLRFTELQLSAAREEGTSLAASIDLLKRELDEAHAEAANQRDLVHRQACAAADGDADVTKAGAAGEAGATSSVRRVARLREEWSQGLIMLPPRPLALRIRETELSAEGLAHSRDGTIQLQEQQLRSLHEKLRRTGESHGSASRALEAANARVVEVERSNSELGQQLLQVHSLLQQLQLDNTRLVKLLASTEEYREFAATSDASGGLTYVPPTQVDHTSKGSEAVKHETPSFKDRLVKGASRESDHWVPADTYALANDFRRQFTPQVPMERFAELLIRLNKVWRVREKRTLERQRSKLQKVISDLRRRLSQASEVRCPHGAKVVMTSCSHSQGLSYEEVIKDSEVERLKRELKE
ncbi:MAG: hypothetical protein SGPRY_011160, partial [Prymnesium sp.]